VKRLLAFEKVLGRLEGFILVLFLATMVGLSFLQVILRNFFETSLPNADILLRHLVLWVAFLGASLATQGGRHIRIDILPNLLPGRSRAVLEIIARGGAAVVSALLTRAAFRLVLVEREAGSILLAGVPIWVFQVIIPIGLLLITFRFSLRTLEGVLALRRPRGE
jgi:TRAP-type C4-dicarboxylate transport system permease small subunit